MIEVKNLEKIRHSIATVQGFKEMTNEEKSLEVNGTNMYKEIENIENGIVRYLNGEDIRISYLFSRCYAILNKLRDIKLNISED